MTKILAVINHWPSAERVLAKAGELARAIHGEEVDYCPVYSQEEELNRYLGFDNYQTVREELVAECQAQLEEMPAAEGLELEVEWQPKPYRGVADKAEELSAAMIVMGVSEHSVIGDFLHKPDDWHLLRDACCPVLILSDRETACSAVTAAVDALDDSDAQQALNARLLDAAVMMSEALGVPLRVVSVVPDPSYLYSDFSATDTLAMTQFRGQAEAAAQRHQRQLLERFGVRAQQAVVLSGRVERHLQEALSHSGLLVIGTIANKGVKGFFLGNTAERLLRHLDGDMLVVS
jgi:universal stress protein E